MNVYCLGCDQSIDLGTEIAIGRQITCPDCETQLEIINLYPIELDWIYDGPTIDNDHAGLYDEDWWEYPSTVDEDHTVSIF